LAEQRSESQFMEDADIMVVAYGSSARICKSAVRLARKKGIKVGIFRPITLWPFPEDKLTKYIDAVGEILVVELSAGQMLEDIKIINNGRKPVAFHGRMGGMTPSVEDIVGEIEKIQKQQKNKVPASLGN